VYDQLDKVYLQLYYSSVPIHDEVLRAARRLCRERRGWTFTAEEVVRALPDLNESSVRTHVVSRCCVNAPKNHPHKWNYFRRVRRGVYEILPAHRPAADAVGAARVAEGRAAYGSPPLRESVHATVSRGENSYVGECWELAVVTQGRTLDEVVSNLREALTLHLDGEDLVSLGLTRSPRLVVTYESPLGNGPSAETTVG
jgi:predicted RNase H-like HicB family nuclease